MSAQQSPQKRKRSSRISACAGVRAAVDDDNATAGSIISHAAPDPSPSPESVDHAVPPQPGTAMYAHLPAMTVSAAGPVQSTLARQVLYSELTVTDVATVVGSQYGEDASARDGSGTDDDLVASMVESGSENDERSSDKNLFLDEITVEASGESSAEGTSQDEREVGGDTGSDFADPSYNLEMSQAPSAPVPASPIHVKERISDPAARHASSCAKVKMEKGLYVNMVLQNGRVAASDSCRDSSIAAPPSSFMTEQLAQYAVDVAHAVVTQPVVLPPPVVYLEDLDGAPVPSRSSRSMGKARAQSLAKQRSTASSAKLPVHISLGDLPSGDGAVLVPVKTMGKLKSQSSGHASSTAKLQATTTSTATPPVIPPSISAVGAPLPTSVVGASDPAFLVMLDAFLGDTFRESSPEDNGEVLTLSLAIPPITVFSLVAALAPPVEPDDEALHVMLPAIQEEQLRKHYASLPGLGTIHAMVPIGGDETTFDQPPYITIDDVARLFNRDTIRSLVAACHFTGSAPYCSMSTLSHTAFTSDGRKPLYQGHTAVAMVTGVVIESALVHTCQLSRYSVSKSVHGVRILPFSQPWHQELTVLGLLFGMTMVWSENISSTGICLATRALSTVSQNNNNRYPSPLLQKPPPAPISRASSGKATPAKSAWPKSPTKSTSLVSRAAHDRDYYHCLGFNDESFLYLTVARPEFDTSNSVN
ncbi:hypothetical protein IW262DRAFT_1462085 [Armillaria fumosa]|nr:hypothetical protein IW262DRAFT_1462085 [Armillaria fumosa]